MKVTVVTPNEDQLADNDFQDSYEIRIDGKRMLVVWDGEPEDNTLSRNFNDVVKLPQLLTLAFEAGLRGETFYIDYKDAEY